MLSRADFAMTENTPQHELLASACRKNAWRLLVILAIAYVVNFLDRNSIAYAGLTMNAALGLTASSDGRQALRYLAIRCWKCRAT